MAGHWPSHSRSVRSVISLPSRVLIAAVVSMGMSACFATHRGAPNRFYSIEQELQALDTTVDRSVAQYNLATDEPTRMFYRNEAIDARVAAIDLRYTEFESALMRERQGVGLLTTMTELALTGTIPLVGSTDAKNLLGGAASFVTGSWSAYYDEVLLKTTAQVIISQMQGNRAKVKTRILLKRPQSTALYTLSAALSDVEDYYRAGTLVGGIVQAAEVVAKNTEAATAEKEAVEIELARDDSVATIRRFLYPDGATLDGARLVQLQQLLQARGISPPSFGGCGSMLPDWRRDIGWSATPAPPGFRYEQEVLSWVTCSRFPVNPRQRLRAWPRTSTTSLLTTSAPWPFGGRVASGWSA